MSKLDAKARNAIPTSDFAGPNRSYPIEDRSHAANAKARVANKSPELKARIDAAVARKYPGMGRADEGGHKDGHTTSGMDKAMQEHADKIHPRGG